MNRNDVAKIWLTDTDIFVELKDGRIGCERYADYRRLSEANQNQRRNYKLSHFGIHWPEIDEDLSYEGFFHHHDNRQP